MRLGSLGVNRRYRSENRQRNASYPLYSQIAIFPSARRSFGRLSNAAFGFGVWWSTPILKITSKVSSRNGSWNMFAWAMWMFSRLPMFRCAASTARLRSTPTTVAPHLEATSENLPMPHPTSRTRLPRNCSGVKPVFDRNVRSDSSLLSVSSWSRAWTFHSNPTFCTSASLSTNRLDAAHDRELMSLLAHELTCLDLLSRLSNDR